MINTQLLKAPFPYFGGKSGAVAQVWEAFGDVKNYVEPFMGSAAMLLGVLSASSSVSFTRYGEV